MSGFSATSASSVGGGESKGRCSIELPSPPQSLSAIVGAASNPKTSIAELAELVSCDPAFSAKILTIANSSFYDRGKKIATVVQAVSVMGARQLRNLALCAAAQSCASEEELGAFDLQRFWEASLRRAVACKVLAEHFGTVDSIAAFTAGLLQDLGVLVLIKSAPQHAAGWMELAEADPETRRVLERELFGWSHDELATELSKCWSFSEDITAAMSFHHHLERAPKEELEICRLCFAAERISGVLGSSSPREALELARIEVGGLYSITRPEVDRLSAAVANEVEKIAKILNIEVQAQPSIESIQMQAFDGIMQMNLSYEHLVRHMESSIAVQDKMNEELASRDEEVQRLRQKDLLTQWTNRKAFWPALQQEAAGIAEGGQLGLVLLDVDALRRVNHAYGYHQGDDVLRQLAQLLGKALKPEDLAARTSGGEFAIVKQNAKWEDLLLNAELYRNRVQKSVIKVTKERTVDLRISVGVAILQGPTKGKVSVENAVNRLFREAEFCLAFAKKEGGNRVYSNGTSILWDGKEKRKAHSWWNRLRKTA